MPPAAHAKDQDAVLRHRIRRFARIEISAARIIVTRRVERDAPDSREEGLPDRVLRFVHRADDR